MRLLERRPASRERASEYGPTGATLSESGQPRSVPSVDGCGQPASGVSAPGVGVFLHCTRSLTKMQAKGETNEPAAPSRWAADDAETCVPAGRNPRLSDAVGSFSRGWPAEPPVGNSAGFGDTFFLPACRSVRFCTPVKRIGFPRVPDAANAGGGFRRFIRRRPGDFA